MNLSFNICDSDNGTPQGGTSSRRFLAVDSCHLIIASNKATDEVAEK